jgi:hypothetical protein
VKSLPSFDVSWLLHKRQEAVMVEIVGASCRGGVRVPVSISQAGTAPAASLAFPLCSSRYCVR